MKDAVLKIEKFNLDRNWPKDPSNMKDFLLNMVEECGEAWTVIKWVDEDKQKMLMEKHKDKFEDFVGDQLFLILKIAWLLDIDPDKALADTLHEYEQRMPADKIRAVKHANPLAGGIDDKNNAKRN